MKKIFAVKSKSLIAAAAALVLAGPAAAEVAGFGTLQPIRAEGRDLSLRTGGITQGAGIFNGNDGFLQFETQQREEALVEMRATCSLLNPCSQDGGNQDGDTIRFEAVNFQSINSLGAVLGTHPGQQVDMTSTTATGIDVRARIAELLGR
jgi:hypothetical protein